MEIGAKYLDFNPYRVSLSLHRLHLRYAQGLLLRIKQRDLSLNITARPQRRGRACRGKSGVTSSSTLHRPLKIPFYKVLLIEFIEDYYIGLYLSTLTTASDVILSISSNEL